MELFRQRLQGFADNVKLFGSNRKLSAGGAADKAGNTDQIADVQAFQKFQTGLVKMAFVAENLDLSALVFQIDEHAAVAHRHRAAGNRHPVFGIFSGRQIFVFFLQIGGKSIRFETIRIGIVAFSVRALSFARRDSLWMLVSVAIGKFLFFSSSRLFFRHYKQKPKTFQPNNCLTAAKN